MENGAGGTAELCRSVAEEGRREIERGKGKRREFQSHKV